MRIGLIASPFISVPPIAYGGTELFIANLAEALVRLGVDVVVYTNGESKVKAERRWLYGKHEWPLSSEWAGVVKEIEHNSWAMAEAERSCNVVHVNSPMAIPLSHLTTKPIVCTLHHPFNSSVSDLYERHTHARYVSISAAQARQHPNIPTRTIHHGIDMNRYRFSGEKQSYLCFLGRICPIKGTHTAIEIAKRVGMPLKIAGEVQPIFQEYFQRVIQPQVDGKTVEFLGEADLTLKNELLSHARALLFPVEWDEPFGLVMIESMACGTPVIAFPGGAVEELVENGISGRICKNVTEAVAAVNENAFSPQLVRRWAEKKFSADSMARQYCQLYADLLEDTALDRGLDIEEAAA
jgi:glycosyltransferase involved in cell wall biosynthesis